MKVFGRNATSRTNVTRGSITFDGAGNGTISFLRGVTKQTTGDSLSDTSTSTRSPITKFTSTCVFTYTVEQDNRFTMEDFWCSSTTIAGGAGDPDTTVTSESTGIVLGGQMALGGQLLLLADINTNEETLTSTTVDNSTDPPEVTIRDFTRICTHRSGTAVRTNK